MDFFGENIWSFEDEIRVAPGIFFPVRMTAIRLSNGGLLLYSPIKMSEYLVKQVEQLGPVNFIIAPNKFHHLFVLDALEYFPKAELYIADGLEKKRPDFKNYKHLSETPDVWAEDIEVIKYEGVPKLGEYVFFHKKSKTLVTADVVLNMGTAKNWFTRNLLKIDGIYQKLSQGRLTDLMTKDKNKRSVSNQKIMDLEFEKVLMAHGDAIRKDAKNLMKEALLPADK